MNLLLKKQLENERVSHAYLLKGPTGSGKSAAAYEFAQKLLGTEDIFKHPDFISLGVDEKISVEEIRHLIARLSVKPFKAKYTLAILENAHLLNASASNALLKQLEEPSPTSIIILLSSGSVLPTIASRCQTLIFNSTGAPSFSSETVENLSELERVRAESVAVRLTTLKKFAELESAELSEIFLAWLHKVKSNLAQNPQSFQLAKALVTAQNQLKGNMNKKFILQQLFLEN